MNINSNPLLREAYDIIDNIPENRFHLGEVRSKMDPNSCKTVSAAAGWLAQHPKFQTLGLGIIKEGLTFNGTKAENWWTPISTVFGVSDEVAIDLFGKLDFYEPSFSDTNYTSDKKSWQNRIQWFFGEKS